MTPKDLKMFRVEHDLTQDDLGKKLGVTGQTISNYENGTPIPVVFELAIKHLEMIYEQTSVEGDPAFS